MNAPRILFSLLSVIACVAASSAPSPPAVMLPVVYHGGLEVADYLVSEKYDGVRGRWDGHRLVTRGGHTIAAPAWFTAGWPTVPMDGELWAGRGRFEDASATVRAADAGDAAWRRLRFMVFDLPADPAAFEQRARHIRTLLDAAGIAWLQPVVQHEVEDEAALEVLFDQVVAGGGEGLVLHRRGARYHAGRSDDLLKYKPYEDAEARVVAHLPGRGKYTGLLGALLVERADGLRFRIGTGFSDTERAHPPPVGSVVTYRYNGVGRNGIPRFARFLRVRHLLPPPDPVPDVNASPGAH